MKNITFIIIFFLVCFAYQKNQVWSLAHTEIDSLCQFYENSLRIAQKTSFKSIALVYLCPPKSTNFQISPLYIQSNAHITSFDVHQKDNFILYLTENYDLFIALLEPANQPSTLGLYEKLTTNFLEVSSTNSTLAPTPNLLEPIWSFTEIKPTQIALDWVHNLLYLLDESVLYVSSLYRPGHAVQLLHRERAHLLQVLVCPALSMIVWSQVEWSSNLVTISVAQQDGTEEKVVFKSKTFIQDMQLEAYSVYFVSGSILGEIPLKEYHQKVSTGDVDHVRRYPITGHGHVNHFAILNSFILKIQSSSLMIQDLQDQNRPVERIPLRYPWASSSIQQPFTLLHKYSQRPLSELVCPPPESEFAVCKDICLPNGYTSKFTCLCYSNDNECPEYGPHHSGGGEEGTSGRDIKIPNLEPDHPFSRLSSYLPTEVPTGFGVNSTVVFHSQLADDLFDEEVQEENKVTTILPSLSTSSPSSSSPTTAFFNRSNLNRKDVKKVQSFSLDAKMFQEKIIISDELFLISKLTSSPTSTLSHLLWYITKKALSGMKFSPNRTSKSRFFFRFNNWIDSHQSGLLITFAIGLFTLISLSVFAFLYLLASFTSSSSINSNSKKNIKISSVKKKKDFRGQFSEEGCGSSPPEVSIISVNKLYMATDLVAKELQTGAFHDREPKPLAFDDSFVDQHHWTVLGSPFELSETPSKQSKLNVTPVTSSPSTSPSSSSTSHEMTTFENWEYSQGVPGSLPELSVSSTSLLLASPSVAFEQKTSPDVPLYL